MIIAAYARTLRPGVGRVPQIIGKSADYANRARTERERRLVTQS